MNIIKVLQVATVMALATTGTIASAQDVSVSINGTVRVQKGDAFAFSNTDSNKAIAVGSDSFAGADHGVNNKAIAVGDVATAIVGQGDNNTAIAVGDDSEATAYGVDNTTDRDVQP